MFKTLRAKLIFSYVAIVVLCLLLALVVTLALARNYNESAIYRNLHEKSALTFPFLQFEVINQDQPRPLSRPVLNRVREGIVRSHTRVLLVKSSTMTIEEDISMRLSAAGKPFGLEAPESQLDQLYTQRGLEGKFRLPGEDVTYLYVARSIQAPPGRKILGNPENYIVILAQPERGVLEFLSGDLRNYLGPAALVALLVSLIAAFGLARSISKPIARLSEGAAAMARGEYDQRIQVIGQDELAALTQRFNQMAEEVGRAHQMERDFVANVSHDLKTPLTSIQGFSQAMLDGAISDEDGYIQAAEIINGEAQRMDRLVSDLLNLSRLQSGLQTLEMRPIDLGALISQLALAMQPQAISTGVEIKLVKKNHSVWVLADSDRLLQAFGNLIDNALKYSPPGGTVSIELREIPAGTEVCVSDSGPGIPTGDLPRVMERFYQVDKSRSSIEGNSTGLGLAIAREIVRAHHGEIAIESAQGEGTTVRVALPTVTTLQKALTPKAGVLKRLGQGGWRSAAQEAAPDVGLLRSREGRR